MGDFTKTPVSRRLLNNASFNRCDGLNSIQKRKVGLTRNRGVSAESLFPTDREAYETPARFFQIFSGERPIGVSCSVRSFSLRMKDGHGGANSDYESTELTT